MSDTGNLTRMAIWDLRNENKIEKREDGVFVALGFDIFGRVCWNWN
jgi:hypothetical protein